MLKILLGGLSLAFITVSAQAAPITYKMLFQDAGGGLVGMGRMTYDPTFKTDIYFDHGNGDLCDTPQDSPFCTYVGSLTAVTFSGTLLGVQLPAGGDSGSFLDGQVNCAGSGCYFEDYGFIQAWSIYNYPRLFLDGTFSPGQRFGTWTDGMNSGRIVYAPVPLPGAVWLFLAGLGALGVKRFDKARLQRP